mmetsp:Transcript_23893/g.49477  ORF Transcript_23893/g.49477 Transcript_23893/m.49477 type:complete len:875 (+) Transcript_23893:106-2730(+)|eukprot:CAMPEP_0171337956 /NCGR_PEP_ID=MMETSP0878-20121228/7018_1 /TAXON_ID=67004 /ORGANISM="Thalassiosira weissflogii, Strain CCMP1336" /LENGTH=874 /DNA_ID=CAMNT_0011839659 /DNA_START=61 /DNA_END=2685 /DNA_ORIENTATION=+
MPTKRKVISITPKALVDTSATNSTPAIATAYDSVPSSTAPAAPTSKPSATAVIKNPQTPPATSKRIEEMVPPSSKRRRIVTVSGGASSAAVGAAPTTRITRVSRTTTAAAPTKEASATRTTAKATTDATAKNAPQHVHSAHPTKGKTTVGHSAHPLGISKGGKASSTNSTTDMSNSAGDHATKNTSGETIEKRSQHGFVPNASASFDGASSDSFGPGKTMTNTINDAKLGETTLVAPPPPPSKRGGAALAGRGGTATNSIAGGGVAMAAKTTTAAAATRKQKSVTNAKAIALKSRQVPKQQPPLPIHLQMQMEANATTSTASNGGVLTAIASTGTKPTTTKSSMTKTTHSTTAKPAPHPAGRTYHAGVKGSAPLMTLSSVATMVPKTAGKPTSTTNYAAARPTRPPFPANVKSSFAPTAPKGNPATAPMAPPRMISRPNGNIPGPMKLTSSTTVPSTSKPNNLQTSAISSSNAANTSPESNPFLAQDPNVPHSTIDEIINEANDLLQAASEAQSLGRLRMSASYLLLAHARLVGLGRRFDRSRCVEMGVFGVGVGVGGVMGGSNGRSRVGMPGGTLSGAGADANVNSNARASSEQSFPPPMEIHSSNSYQGPPSTLSAPSAGPPPYTQSQTPQESAPKALNIPQAPHNPQKPLSQQSHTQQPYSRQLQLQNPQHLYPQNPSNTHPQYPHPPPPHLQRPYPYPRSQHPHPPQPTPTLPPLVQTANLPPPNVEHDAAMMEQLARTAMELHHKRTGRGMQHEALLEKQKLLEMAKSKDGSGGEGETLIGGKESLGVRAEEEGMADGEGGEEEKTKGKKGRGRGKGKGRGKNKEEAGAEGDSSPMKRKGGRGKKPPTLVMHTLPCATLDAKKLMRGCG